VRPTSVQRVEALTVSNVTYTLSQRVCRVEQKLAERQKRMKMQRHRNCFFVFAIASIYLFTILVDTSAIRSGAFSDMVSHTSQQTLNGAHKTTLGLVVSVCKEPRDAVQEIENFIVRLKNSGFDVRRHIYCKCGPWHAACDRNVPNLGREGETFMRHIVDNYHTLDDVIWFVNGGFLSKKHTRKAVARHMRVFTSRALLGRFHAERNEAQTVYLDDWITSFESVNLRQEIRTEDLSQSCFDDASKHCSSMFRCEYTLPCTHNQACACEVQRDCQWIGATKSNYWNTSVEGNRLQVPAPDASFPYGHSLYTWTCLRFNLGASLMHRCGASRSGVFAVGASRIRAYPRSMYRSLVTEYETYGINGGVVSHYAERVYRSLFFCALSHMRLTHHPLHVIKVSVLHSKRALMWNFR